MTASHASTTRGFVSQMQLARLFDLRPGEASLVALLSFAGFALITAYYFLKPVAKSLFLASYSAEEFRWVYLSIGPIAALVGMVYAQLARRVALVPLFNGMMIALLLGLVAFRLALHSPMPKGPLAFALNIYQQEFGVLGVALFYLAINHLLEPRQARRLLGLIGAGLIVGGLTGGYVVKVTVPYLGTENMLWGAVILLALAIAALDIVFWRAPRLGRPRPDTRKRGGNALTLVLGQPYLRRLVVLIGLVMLCATLADYQFNWAVQAFVPAGDETTAYLGFWFSTISAISLPAQLLLTAPILRRFGVGPALMILPVGMLLVGGGMLAAPGLLFGTAMKVGDGSLRYSLNKSAVELLYLPLPLWLKDRTKVFIDTSLDRLAKSGAGALLVLLVDVFQVGIRGAAGVSAGLAAIWIGWALSLRHSYLDAFREALRRGSLEPLSEQASFTEPGLHGPLLEGLHSSSTEVVRRSLDLLLDAHRPEFSSVLERLSELAASQDPEIAQPALLLGGEAPNSRIEAVALQRLADPDAGVAGAAARALLASRGEDPDIFRERLAAQGTRQAHLAAAALLSKGHDLPDELIERILIDEGDAAAEARRQLAEALSRGELPGRRELLRRLMADPVPRVAIAALRGAGDLNSFDLVPFMVVALRASATRRAARESLRRLGPRVLPLLQEYLSSSRLDHDLRRRLPRAIAGVGGPQAFAILAQALDEEDPQLRHRVLRVLARAAQDMRQLQLPQELLESELRDECHALARLIASIARPGGPGPARALFERATREAISNARVRAFRLLGLRGKRDDWEHAVAGLSSADTRLRATAVEFADGSLPERLRHLVVPLVDDIAAADALHRVGRHLDIRPLKPGEAYAIAAAGADRWLASCAFAAAAEEGERGLIPLAEKRREDPDRWVAEAARAALARLEARLS